MPLVQGKAATLREGFSENIRQERRAGKPLKQALAIAYSQARKYDPHYGLGLVLDVYPNLLNTPY